MGGQRTAGGRPRWRRGPWRGKAARGLTLWLLLVSCAPSEARQLAEAARPVAVDSGAAATVASSPPTPGVPAPLRLVLNYSARGSGQAGMWLAYEGGGLRELGVDAELQNVAATSRIIPAMLAGEVNLSGMDPGASILASLEGVDMALLFAGANRPTLSIIAQPSIDEPAKLSGKTLAITRLGSATHTSAILALDLFGLKADRDVTLLQVGEPGAMVAGLEAQQLDAAVLNSPFTTLARRAGYRELINLSTAGPEYPTVVVGALRSWVAANEEAVRRFARAYTRGRQRAREDKAWALAVFRKYLQVEDAEALEDFYQEVSACCAAVPYVTEAGTARLLADLAQAEPRLAGHEPNEWIDSRFLREVEAEGRVR